MIWLNQAGPVDGWIRDGGKEDPLFGFYALEGRPQPAYTNLFMMGLPPHISNRYIHEGEFAEGLANLGLTASAAPNSVCIRSNAVSKDLPVRWLAERPEYGLRFSHTVAFGDNPLGNDRPLALLPLPFVSVAPELSAEFPPELGDGGFHQVGGCEVGTAAVVDLLNIVLEAEGDGAAALRQLPSLCARAREGLADAASKVPAAPVVAAAL
uniref:Uncharacterized protein n=1 Tax=Alexandrium catenella TaxID=2925 RepID=A0A7S1WHB4_ALECA